jgi:hypothetical protein
MPKQNISIIADNEGLLLTAAQDNVSRATSG